MHPSTKIQEGFKFGGVVLPKIKISVFGAKMLLGPETPGISPDTPGFETLWAKLRVVASSHWLY